MGKTKHHRRRPGFKITPLSTLGLAYGAIINPYYGGGMKYDGSAGGAKGRWDSTQDLGDTGKEFIFGALENFTGYNAREGVAKSDRWKLGVALEGWGPLALGMVGDAVLSRLKVYRGVNKVLRGLGIRKARLGSPI